MKSEICRLSEFTLKLFGRHLDAHPKILKKQVWSLGFLYSTLQLTFLFGFSASFFKNYVIQPFARFIELLLDLQ